MAKPATKRPNVDTGRSDSFLRMLALEKQYRMERIQTQVAAASMKSTSLDSTSTDTSAVLPLRVRRASNTSGAPVGSSQIPVQSQKQFKDVPLPSLSISIPVPSRPLATAVRDEVPEQVETPQSQHPTPASHPQPKPAPEKPELSKMVTFAAEEDENDLSDQTSICQSPTWDARKKKKTKPAKQAKPPKPEPVVATKSEDAPPSPTKKKGRRLSKQPPTPGPRASSVVRAERSSSSTRFDLEDIENQAPQNKAMRSRPPDAMKNPDLHQQGNVSDSNDKPRSKGFFSRIRRLSFDDGSKSPKSAVEQVAAPPPVQKSHSSGPGAGLGFFSSRKPQNKDSSKASSPRSQSALDSRPPVTSRPSSSGRGRNNSLLSATLEKFKTGQKTSAEVDDGDRAPTQEVARPSDPESGSAVRVTRLVKDDEILPFDLEPPAANFSQKPRSRSSDSRSTLDNRPESKGSEKDKAEQSYPYQTTESKDESEFGSLSTLRLQQLPLSELALRSARSSEFETASIQESIFNVVKIEERSSDYLNFINESYTPPSLELSSTIGGRSSPMYPAPSPRPAHDSYQAREQRATNARHSERPSRLQTETTQQSPVVQQRTADTSKPLPPLQKSPSLEKFGQSWSAGPEPAAADAADLRVPVLLGAEQGHSRTASEKSTSSLYDDSAPTPSTPATPDSVVPPRRQDVHPALRASSHEQRAKEQSAHSESSGERRPRNTVRQYSQETARPTSDRSLSREPRTSEHSYNKARAILGLDLGLDPPPANFFSRAEGNGSSSSIASSPTSIKSASAIKVDVPSSNQQDRVRAREMPPRAQSAIDLTSTSFLPPLKHQPLLGKKKPRHSTTAASVSSPESADEENDSSRPKASRSSTANSQESGAGSSAGAAYLEEARKAVQPISAARALKAPFTQKNASSMSVKTAQGSRAEPIAKMLVECCGCKFYHDMPSKVYECMAKPDSIVEDKRLGVSAAVTTMVRCPWCGHGMSTQCCAGYAAVIFLKEKLHGK